MMKRTTSNRQPEIAQPAVARTALTVREVQASTSLGRDKVLHLVHTGELRSKRVDRRILIPVAALDEYLNGRAS